MSDFLTSLLPFLLLFVFWIFLMRRAQSGKLANPTVEKLEEIRQELVGIREELRRQNF